MMIDLLAQAQVSVDENITTIVLAIISSITATVASILAFMSLQRGKDQDKKIEEVHTTVNSRMGELLETTKSLARAAGVEEGRTGVSQPDTLPMTPQPVFVPEKTKVS